LIRSAGSERNRPLLRSEAVFTVKNPLPRVAVIGAGIAGLSCAALLAEAILAAP